MTDWSAILTLVLTLQGVSLILLTLFAPFAIGILISYFTGTKPEIKSLEQRILLTQVLHKERFFLALIALLVLPFSALTIPVLPWLFGILFVPWGLSVGYFFVTLYFFYEWLVSKRIVVLYYFHKPLQLPSKKKWNPKKLIRIISGVNLREKADAWNNLWSIDLLEERYFTSDEGLLFNYFSYDVDNLINTTDNYELKYLSSMLSVFANTMGKRSLFGLLGGDISRKALGWHYLIWTKWLKNVPSKKEGAYISYPTGEEVQLIEVFLGKIISHLHKSFLKGDKLLLHSDNANLIAHIERYGDEKAIDGTKYLDTLKVLEAILDVLVDLSPSEYSTRTEWKITFPRVQEDFLTGRWLREFLSWFEKRMIGIKPPLKIERGCEEIIRRLFPEIDTIAWAKIVAFSIRSYSVEENIRKPLMFENGHTVEDVDLAKIDKTCELAEYALQKEFTSRNISDWTTELNKLDYEEGSPEKAEKDFWLLVFKKLGMLARARAESAKQKKSDSADEQADSSARQTD